MILLALALLQTAAPATRPAAPPAAPPAPTPTCTSYDAALPLALAAWTKPDGAFDTFGATTLVTTDPGSVVPPQKPGRVATVGFTIHKPGQYRIALDQPGWIDLARASDPAPLKPVAFGHGPNCSTIRKLVAYDLSAGEYMLRVSGLARSSAKVMLVEGS
jgi:hypothetical protein